MTDLVSTGCERCGRCIASCPTGALSFSLRGTAGVRLAPEPDPAAPRAPGAKP